MLSTELHDAAVAFGRSLAQAPAVAAYRAASAALDADPIAQTVLANLREQLAAVARIQQTGLTPSPGDLDRLRERQAAVRANDCVMASLRTTNDVKAYLPVVAREVSVALGTDYASLIAPTSC